MKINFKKVAIISSILVVTVAIFTSVYASTFLSDTFILDKGHDLGKVEVQSGNWYKPTIKYTDSKGVKAEMLKEFNYPGTFYTDRGFTKSIIEGNDQYFKVEWSKPDKDNSLEAVQKDYKGFYFSWRKNGQIQWTNSADMNESFLSGYGSATDKSVITYPIRDVINNEVVAYLQYPCGNLVCRDTGCLDLQPKKFCGDGVVSADLGEMCDPKDPKTKKNCTKTCSYPVVSCALKPKSESYYTNSCASLDLEKSSSVKMTSYVSGADSKTSYSCFKFDKPGTYEIVGTGTDSNTSKTVTCKTNVKIISKPVCGDGIKHIDMKEECDLGKNNGVAGLGCTSSCKYEKPSCDLNIKSASYFKGQSFSESDFTLKYKGTLSSRFYNDTTVGMTSPLTINYCKNTIKYIVSNPIDPSITTSCYDTFSAKVSSYCGDGKVDKGEDCDYRDGSSNGFCDSTCKFKKPTICQIEMGDEFFLGDNIKGSIITNSDAKITELKLNSDKVSASSQSFSIKPKTAGNHSISVTVGNKGGVMTCTKNITVKTEEICK